MALTFAVRALSAREAPTVAVVVRYVEQVPNEPVAVGTCAREDQDSPFGPVVDAFGAFSSFSLHWIFQLEQDGKHLQDALSQAWLGVRHSSRPQRV